MCYFLDGCVYGDFRMIGDDNDARKTKLFLMGSIRFYFIYPAVVGL